ncbi:MAG TPA: hypothetical protein DEQ64_03695 [Lachnoclostridium sp.]|uniref:substrate-binding domain-containing protein n=1 Tax=Lacrimispora sp. TaxID=2719234 RepID=UPI000EC07A01|nr:substrate-binding domain-containing protein [Lacrimispora sp.]HCD42839.1 hypothetical protein [Lachnoclostridium sp.]
MRRLTIFMTVAALTAVALSGCSTSNQKAPEPAATTAPAAETYAEKAGAADTSAAAGTEEYGVKPRKITDRKIKLGLIPVTMNTAYTMTINGAKKQIAENGDQIELIVQAPSSNASTITEQGNIMETMIQQGVDAIALATESDESMLPYLREAAEADVLLLSPNTKELYELCDRVYIMREGKVVDMRVSP